MNKAYDLLGIGIGPFNLSLAALLKPIEEINIKFLEAKSEFSWHPELMFDDAPMQTSFLKDLVTPVMPTNSCSFLNYLVEKGQFYQFLNTSRTAITRYEFDNYLKWAAHQLNNVLEFDSAVQEVRHNGEYFEIQKKGTTYLSKNICIASGPVKNIPECARGYLGDNIFHAKDKRIQEMNLENKKILIIGGGQTGVETFRNILHDKWGRASHVQLITGRESLLPLDEGPFTNEIFSPDFVSNFHSLDQNKKDEFTRSLLLASDGNTPSYLQELYNELYLDTYYKNQFIDYEITPMCWLRDISQDDIGYKAVIENLLNRKKIEVDADIIILATGFCTQLPKFLEPIKDKIIVDEYNRPKISLDYKLETKLEKGNLYAMNYSRHGHGIADPQTSLMSWRSSVIANSLLERREFIQQDINHSFLNYFHQGSSK